MITRSRASGTQRRSASALQNEESMESRRKVPKQNRPKATQREGLIKEPRREGLRSSRISGPSEPRRQVLREPRIILRDIQLEARGEPRREDEEKARLEHVWKPRSDEVVREVGRVLLKELERVERRTGIVRQNRRKEANWKRGYEWAKEEIAEVERILRWRMKDKMNAAADFFAMCDSRFVLHPPPSVPLWVARKLNLFETKTPGGRRAYKRWKHAQKKVMVECLERANPIFRGDVDLYGWMDVISVEFWQGLRQSSRRRNTPEPADPRDYMDVSYASRRRHHQNASSTDSSDSSSSSASVSHLANPVSSNEPHSSSSTSVSHFAGPSSSNEPHSSSSYAVSHLANPTSSNEPHSSSSSINNFAGPTSFDEPHCSSSYAVSHLAVPTSSNEPHSSSSCAVSHIASSADPEQEEDPLRHERASSPESTDSWTTYSSSSSSSSSSSRNNTSS